MDRFPEQSAGYKIAEFLEGQADASAHRPHKEGKSAEYDNGYEYECFREAHKISELGELL